MYVTLSKRHFGEKIYIHKLNVDAVCSINKSYIMANCAFDPAMEGFESALPYKR